MHTTPDFHISRRTFVRRCLTVAAATGLPLWFVERQLARAEEQPAPSTSPNERPRLALIGCGGMGMIDARDALRFGDFVALCDVDRRHLDAAAAELGKDRPAPAQFSDFRKLLEQPGIDAVFNCTPDHWHSLVNIAAARAGRDTYSEKPLTLTIDEGRHVIRAVREHKIILQTGTQQRSSKRFRLACELVRNGRIGRLQEVSVWLPAGLRGGPFASQPVPEGLDWDFWQGQARAYDYVPERCHNTFRNWYDYSGGTMTDWGAHHMDIGYWAIGLVAPERVESRRLAEPIPGGFTTVSEYEVKFTYANGVVFNVRTTPDDSPFGAVINPEGQRNGIRFTGSDGWIWVNRDEINASSRDLITTPLPEGAEHLYLSNDHKGNFFECARTRQDPVCPAEVGHRSASVCHLGAISLRTGRALRWDSEAERFTGEHAAEANTYLAREMRAPYDYSFVS